MGTTGGLAPSCPHHRCSLHELSYLRFDFLGGVAHLPRDGKELGSGEGYFLMTSEGPALWTVCASPVILAEPRVREGIPGGILAVHWTGDEGHREPERGRAGMGGGKGEQGVERRKQVASSRLYHCSLPKDNCKRLLSKAKC